MLKTLDVLIGLSVVMLLVSMVVTMMTQAVTSLINSRGRHLLKGIADLLEQIQPGIGRDTAEKISTAVLTHPMIRATGGRLGAVVHREELTKILMELASGDSPQTLEGTAKQALVDALRTNGISNPKQTVDNVRALLLQLEISNPELANHARQSVAMLHEANSAFLAKINNWFDQTIDRVSERFTFTTRMITFVCGLVLAFVIQFDAISLANRLSSDPQFRSQLVQDAIKQQNKPMDPSTASRSLLSSAEIVTVPASFDEWYGNWSRTDLPPTIPGVLLSAALLSLGAPFWYNALQNLIRLRSVIAAKDDVQRSERQSTQAAIETPVGPASAEPPALVGERGDLGSLG